MRHATRVGLVGLIVATLGGCGDSAPPAVPVEGTITLDGKPAANLMVQFNPTGTGDRVPFGSSAVSDSAGKFVLKCETGAPGAVPGSHKVTVYDNALADEDDASLGKRGVKRPVNRVPAVYSATTSTPLTVTVEAGKTGYTLDVKSK
jgi:hypothetical protein